MFSKGESIDKFGIVLSEQVYVVQDSYYANRSILEKIYILQHMGQFDVLVSYGHFTSLLLITFLLVPSIFLQ